MSAREGQQQGPLVIEVPAGWEMKYWGEEVDFYTLTKKEPDVSVPMLSRWSAGGGQEQIPAWIGERSKSFSESAKGNKEFKWMNPDAKSEDLEGENFSGKYVAFEVEIGSESGVVEVIDMVTYMVSDGAEIWNGQFTGFRAQWTEALGVIRKLKRKG